MEYKSKKKLERLNNKEFFQDIKNYLQSSHEFYKNKVPEIKVIAKNLHEKNKLKDFYKIFNKLWNSGSLSEMSLAIYTLKLYKEDFNTGTWRFIKPKLNQIKDYGLLDGMAKEIVGEIILRNPKLKSNIFKLSKNKDIWMNRLAILSTFPLIKNEDTELAMTIAELHLHNEERKIQSALGTMLREVGKIKPEIVKRFLMNNENISKITFFYATEDMKELRKLRNLERIKLNQKNKGALHPKGWSLLQPLVFRMLQN